jgi:hypothetical protein
MDYFDVYKKRINTFKEFDSLSRVSLNSIVIVNEDTEIAAQIVDDSATKDQKAITVIDFKLKNGDIIDWQNEKWINIVTDNMADIYYRGVLRRCNGSLKWVDTQGEINKRYFTFKSDPSTNFGVSDGRILSIGNERRTLLVSCDDDTRLFKRDQRFIFDSRAWKITAIDNISIKNISIVTFEEDQINTAKDNLELEIANYVAPVTPPVETEPVLSKTVTISGDNSIIQSRSKSYLCTFYQDGIPINQEGKFTLTDLNRNPTALANIESQSNNTCIVKGIALGYVLLHVSNADKTIEKELKIQIKPIF